MLEALRALGVDWSRAGGRTVRVRGAAGAFPVKRAQLFLGNAGTVFRPLTAVLALMGGDYRLEGVARMHERPIGDLVDALNGLGARIEFLGNPGYPPLAISPAEIRAGGAVSVRGDVSSQFLTGLLIALPLTGARTRRYRGGRAGFETLCRDHVKYDAPVRRRGRARRLDDVHCACSGALRERG